MVLRLFSVLLVAAQPAIPPRPLIAVNQVGYLTLMPKGAFFIGETAEEEAQLVDRESGQVVLRIPMGGPEPDPRTHELLRLIDFSARVESGIYELRAGAVRSFPFRIQENVYDATLRLMLRS